MEAHGAAAAAVTAQPGLRGPRRDVSQSRRGAAALTSGLPAEDKGPAAANRQRRKRPAAAAAAAAAVPSARRSKKKNRPRPAVQSARRGFAEAPAVSRGTDNTL